MILNYDEKLVADRVTEIILDIDSMFNDLISQKTIEKETYYIEGQIELTKKEWEYINFYGRVKFFFSLIDKDIYGYSIGSEGELNLVKRVLFK